MLSKVKLLSIACLFSVTNVSYAALEIDVTSKASNQKTVVLSNVNSSPYTKSIGGKIAKNLSILGNVKLMNSSESCENIALREKISYYCMELKGDADAVSMEMYEKYIEVVASKRKLLISPFDDSHDDVAKGLSEKIYSFVFNKDSFYSSKLAYVERKTLSKGNQLFNLKISDYDGKNQKVLLASNQPILSIDWSPDNSKIAYVSYENVRSNVFIYDFENKTKRKITSFKGINAFPSWSPNGRKLALSLSKDGTSDIYIHKVGSNSISKITNFNYDATEPVWVSDDELVFTSNKTGVPYLYKLNIRKKTQKKLSTNFLYTTSAKASNDLKNVYSVYSKRGKSGIVETNLSSGKETIIKEDFFAESPSLAAGDEMMIYSTKKNNKDILRAVDLSGNVIYEIESRSTDLKEPSYSN